MATLDDVEKSVLDILEKAKPERLSVEQVKNKLHEPPIRPSEKLQAAEDALNSLFDKGLIKRELIENAGFVYCVD